jgi:hypothetical protein
MIIVDGGTSEQSVDRLNCPGIGKNLGRTVCDSRSEADVLLNIVGFLIKNETSKLPRRDGRIVMYGRLLRLPVDKLVCSASGFYSKVVKESSLGKSK